MKAFNGDFGNAWTEILNVVKAGGQGAMDATKADILTKLQKDENVQKVINDQINKQAEGAIAKKIREARENPLPFVVGGAGILFAILLAGAILGRASRK